MLLHTHEHARVHRCQHLLVLRVGVLCMRTLPTPSTCIYSSYLCTDMRWPEKENYKFPHIFYVLGCTQICIYVLSIHWKNFSLLSLWFYILAKNALPQTSIQRKKYAFVEACVVGSCCHGAYTQHFQMLTVGERKYINTSILHAI